MLSPRVMLSHVLGYVRFMFSRDQCLYPILAVLFGGLSIWALIRTGEVGLPSMVLMVMAGYIMGVSI